ncbi:hypothetical protein FB451DRAFT_1178442 [Mycena latifolia]|nr:hypothetical protein FB451DRAFT_1178442 [Mycena latifolia]
MEPDNPEHENPALTAIFNAALPRVAQILAEFGDNHPVVRDFSTKKLVQRHREAGEWMKKLGLVIAPELEAVLTEPQLTLLKDNELTHLLKGAGATPQGDGCGLGHVHRGPLSAKTASVALEHMLQFNRAHTVYDADSRLPMYRRDSPSYSESTEAIPILVKRRDEEMGEGRPKKRAKRPNREPPATTVGADSGKGGWKLRPRKLKFHPTVVRALSQQKTVAKTLAQMFDAEQGREIEEQPKVVLDTDEALGACYEHTTPKPKLHKPAPANFKLRLAGQAIRPSRSDKSGCPPTNNSILRSYVQAPENQGPMAGGPQLHNLLLEELDEERLVDSVLGHGGNARRIFLPRRDARGYAARGNAAVVALIVRAKHTLNAGTTQNMVSVSIIKIEEKGGKQVVTSWVENQERTPA